MDGVKRKIAIEKIKKKDSRAVTFSKRRKGLYSKASELCLLSDGDIAIIATPVSSNSNASFYTFGHSSVDSVVAAFLENQRPCDEKLGFWWEDESLVKSENLEELREAMDSMSTMLRDLKELEKQKQTLNLQPCSASVCVEDDVTVNFQGFHKNTEEKTLAVSDNSNNDELPEMKLGNGQSTYVDFYASVGNESVKIWSQVKEGMFALRQVLLIEKVIILGLEGTGQVFEIHLNGSPISNETKRIEVSSKEQKYVVGSEDKGESKSFMVELKGLEMLVGKDFNISWKMASTNGAH